METGRCDKAKFDQGQEVDECTAACCDPSRNYRLRVRSVVKEVMTNVYINRCWCEWANSGTCKYEDGSRCHKICCDHLRQSIQRDASRMENLLDYLESIHHHSSSSSSQVVSSNDEDNDDSEYEPLPHCDCGWANRRSCRHDDGTVCHYVCCPRHRSSKHLRQRGHYFTPKRKLTFVDKLRAMLRTRQHHDGILVPL